MSDKLTHCKLVLGSIVLMGIFCHIRVFVTSHTPCNFFRARDPIPVENEMRQRPITGKQLDTRVRNFRNELMLCFSLHGYWCTVHCKNFCFEVFQFTTETQWLQEIPANYRYTAAAIYERRKIASYQQRCVVSEFISFVVLITAILRVGKSAAISISALFNLKGGNLSRNLVNFRHEKNFALPRPVTTLSTVSAATTLKSHSSIRFTKSDSLEIVIVVAFLGILLELGLSSCLPYNCYALCHDQKSALIAFSWAAPSNCFFLETNHGCHFENPARDEDSIGLFTELINLSVLSGWRTGTFSSLSPSWIRVTASRCSAFSKTAG